MGGCGCGCGHQQVLETTRIPIEKNIKVPVSKHILSDHLFSFLDTTLTVLWSENKAFTVVDR